MTDAKPPNPVEAVAIPLPASPSSRALTGTAVAPFTGEWLPAPTLLGDGPQARARLDEHGEQIPDSVLHARALAVADPAGLFHYAQVRALQALSANTLRGYRADWGTFVRFCEAHGFCALPAPRAVLEAFIEWRSPWNRELAAQGKYLFFGQPQPRAPASAGAVARALTAIGAVHQALRLPNASADPEVRATLKIHCEWRRTQRQKKPLRWEQVQAALSVMAEDRSLRSARNQAMLAFAYSTLLRRSELVAVELEHYERDPTSDTGRLRLIKTKTGVEQHPQIRHVRAEAVLLLEAWVARAGIASGALFRGIDPGGRVSKRSLDPGEVARIFKYAATLIGEPAGSIGAHSTRIGATKDLSSYGAELPEIMTEGGWKSPQMPALYLREHEADRGAMARMARAQNKKTKPE